MIGLVPGQIVSESLVEELVRGPLPTRSGTSPKIAVVERHLGTGRIGLGFVRAASASPAAPSPRLSPTTRTTSSSSA